MAQKPRENHTAKISTKNKVPESYTLKSASHQRKGNDTLLSYHTINRYYSDIQHHPFSCSQNFYTNNTLTKMAKCIMEMIEKEGYRLTTAQSLPENFYSKACVKIRKEIPLQAETDREILTINLKQINHLLRSAGILCDENGCPRINGNWIDDEALYMKLFISFWHETDWQEIFPSHPAAARDLHNNRSIIKDILLHHTKPVKLAAVANSFFEMTGFAEKDDLFFTSFLDFYLFAWLKHFNLIKYSSMSDKSPVNIIVTDEGRRLLSTLE